MIIIIPAFFIFLGLNLYTMKVGSFIMFFRKKTGTITKAPVFDTT